MPESSATAVQTSLRQHYFEDAVSAAESLAVAIAQRLREAISTRGQASLAVPGGRSPIMLFAALRKQPLDWKNVWITLTDERWVDPASPDSNERLLREHLLLDGAGSACFVPLKSAHAEPSQAALDDLGRQLRRMPRPFDAVMLGMGDDGHVASLFPGAAGLAAALDLRATALLAAMKAPAAPQLRVSQTLGSLLDARQIFFLLGGEKKFARFNEALAGASPLNLPVAAVLTQHRVAVEVYWTDRENSASSRTKRA